MANNNNTTNNRPVILKNDLTPERLAIHLAAAGEKGLLSVDCEMMGLKPIRDRLCLVQMADENGNITLLQIETDQQEAPNLKILLESEKVIKIFHFARADLAFLRYQLGILVNPVFCTKIASKLARTYTDRHGLRELAREFVGIDLNKNQQSSDWGKDTLSQEQIEYAANDVVYLIQLKNMLEKVLIRENRFELAEKCFEQIHLMVELDLLEYDFVFEHNNPAKSGR
jgi:ribonuclease D